MTGKVRRGIYVSMYFLVLLFRELKVVFYQSVKRLTVNGLEANFKDAFAVI